MPPARLCCWREQLPAVCRTTGRLPAVKKVYVSHFPLFRPFAKKMQNRATKKQALRPAENKKQSHAHHTGSRAFCALHSTFLHRKSHVTIRYPDLEVIARQAPFPPKGSGIALQVLPHSSVSCCGFSPHSLFIAKLYRKSRKKATATKYTRIKIKPKRFSANIMW